MFINLSPAENGFVVIVKICPRQRKLLYFSHVSIYWSNTNASLLLIIMHSSIQGQKWYFFNHFCIFMRAFISTKKHILRCLLSQHFKTSHALVLNILWGSITCIICSKNSPRMNCAKLRKKYFYNVIIVLHCFLLYLVQYHTVILVSDIMLTDRWLNIYMRFTFHV